MKVYYNGDIGDLGNVDWFDAADNKQIKDVTHVKIYTMNLIPYVELAAIGAATFDAEIVRAPNLQPDPALEGATLFAVRLEQSHNNQIHTNRATLAQVGLDSGGRAKVVGENLVHSMNKVSDREMANHADPDTFRTQLLRELGAGLGWEMIKNMTSSTILDTIGFPPANIPDERNEGDDLLDFFSRSQHGD